MSTTSMPETERRFTTKGIVFFGALSVFLLLLHATDMVASGQALKEYGNSGAATLSLLLVLTLYVFGIGWSWKERKLGYVIVLVLSPFVFLRFLLHAFTLAGSVSLETIAAAYTSEALGAFFLFVYVALGLTGLMTLLLTIYALFVSKRK